MIYIDPPYNTGNDFVYPDDYADNLGNYLRMTGQVDDAGKAYSSNTENNGRYHSDWLNMMYPRLRLARNLLRDDGAIFISIDDNEASNLRKICDEIFGETNFVAQIIWERAFAPVNLMKQFSTSHDYILVYAKNVDDLVCYGLLRTSEADDRYQNPDNDPRGVWSSSDMSVGPAVQANIYPITTPSGRIVEPPAGRSWRLSKNAFLERLQDNQIWFGEDGNGVPRIKRFLSNLRKEGITPMTVWKFTEVGHTQDAKKKLNQLFGGHAIFDYPKGVPLIHRMLSLYTKSDAIILDFFSGSATTAHAVMQLNAEDGGHRRFIMVQLPEPCKEGSEAYKAGYKTICDIGKERIRRAGEKIKTELREKSGGQTTLDGSGTSMNPDDLDIGFKVFKLDTSNILAWQPDTSNLNQTLTDYVDNLDPNRSELDLVYELMIKEGLSLTEQIEERTIAGKNIYSIGCGLLQICLDDHITAALVREMVNHKPEENLDAWRVIFKDNGFASDSDKLNAREILKAAGLAEDAFRTI
ncbi:site-specific DNA-methyltransferase [Methanocorpusculum sp. MG]|uniref:Site-specific DNA-methyltransferase n=1 Tax=Methanocorpusculum petauri TaxID=3002863 RepID=A0ABT4IDT9_9EURY|nr:site-specific DNA-methyltransferase [Methanocorpusculum petauri]MCZ0859741.1 site-specific DNA-methyltransferase [Methanocorpusculum petauri]